MRRGFVILDFETTGLSPKTGDRILELGAIYMDPDLRIDGGIDTLINPRRDVGPTRIHGISARDVIDAPTFDQVAPALIDLLDGRVIVGHNVAFDLRFLDAELRRDGWEVPDFVAIDTLRVAKALLKERPPANFKLHDLGAHLGVTLQEVCEFVGIEPRAEHSAFGDALVTAFVLSHFVQASPGSQYWASALERADAVVWPERYPIPVSGKRRSDLTRSVAASAPSRSMTDVISAIGGARPSAVSTSEYAELLESVLTDGVLDADEIDRMIDAAGRLELDAATLGSLHRGYFDQLVQRAWSDGRLTPDEVVEIERMAEMLGIDVDSVRSATAPRVPVEALAIEVGSVIVLTGEMSRPRGVIEAELAQLGFVAEGSVTKRTRLVIASDVLTQSGKAGRARALGIPVLSEADGLALLRGGANPSDGLR